MDARMGHKFPGAGQKDNVTFLFLFGTSLYRYLKDCLPILTIDLEWEYVYYLGLVLFFPLMSLFQIAVLQDWYSQSNNLYLAFFVLEYFT